MTQRKIVVTGASGGLGQAVTRVLVESGYTVLGLDRRPDPTGHKPSWTVDLLNSGDLYEACNGAWGVVHLAAHTAPGLASDSSTFGDNVRMTYNTLHAALNMGVRRCVMASSTAVYGFLYGLGGENPLYLPVDEAHPLRPVDPYGLSKVAGERVSDSFAQKYEDASIVSLRFPGINYDPAFERVLRLQSDPGIRAPGFWSYVDARDAASAVLLALEKEATGHRTYNIACGSSNMAEPTSELVEHYFPGLEDIRKSSKNNWSGIDSSSASRDLGFVAKYAWEKVGLT